MADRSLEIYSVVNAGQSDTVSSAAIPNGMQVLIDRAIFSDINMGDNKSTTYAIEYGSGGAFSLIMAFAVTGDTRELKINKTVTGDGTKVLRLTRTNNSATNKRCPCIIVIYDRL